MNRFDGTEYKGHSNMDNKRKGITTATIVGSAILILILVLGTVWMGRSAKSDTEKAVRSVSLFYLNELAGRREQVVDSGLSDEDQKPVQS